MIVFCGHGRSGKDTAAFMFSQITGLKYAGSISWVHKSIVAEQLNLPEQIAWILDTTIGLSGDVSLMIIGLVIQQFS